MTREEFVLKAKELKDVPIPVMGAAEPVAMASLTEEHLIGFSAINTDVIFKFLDALASAGQWLPVLSWIPGIGPFVTAATMLIPQIPRIKEFITLIVDFINTFADKAEGVKACHAALVEAAA